MVLPCVACPKVRIYYGGSACQIAASRVRCRLHVKLVSVLKGMCMLQRAQPVVGLEAAACVYDRLSAQACLQMSAVGNVCCSA
jgi:hypothetical protein